MTDLRSKAIRNVKSLFAMRDNAATENERIAASRIIEKLCSKYGIDEKEIIKEESRTNLYGFSYRSSVEETLITQIIYKHTGKDVNFFRKGKQRKIFAHLTSVKYLLCKKEFKIYNDKLNKEIEVLLSAFIQVNNIFPSSSDSIKKNDQLTDEEVEFMKKTVKMMRNIDKTRILEEIGVN